MGGAMEEVSRKSSHQQNNKKPRCSVLKVCVLLVSTNLLSLLVARYHHHQSSSNLLVELSQVRLRLSESTSAVESLLLQLNASGSIGDGELPTELRLAVGPHKLPLGFTSNFGGDEIHLPVGAGCQRWLVDDVRRYMTYPVGGECPGDDVFAQQLMLRGCEPLPRRRCHPKSPVGYVEPLPVPESLWSTPPDSSIVWEAYSCKSYGCLVNRRKEGKKSYDCKDCFDLDGRERLRWLKDTDSVDYGMDAVLSYRRRGTVRIGLDIGGGSGTFAARMRERNVTVVTTSMNFDGPFNSFIASRGLVPLHVSVSQRLPFFDNTLDLVHSMHVLSNWIPDVVLQFTLYDIYRVLRPGGLFWLDRFFCIAHQLNHTYAPMLRGIGFRTLRWNVAAKLDRGHHRREYYLSALLEKPLT